MLEETSEEEALRTLDMKYTRAELRYQEARWDASKSRQLERLLWERNMAKTELDTAMQAAASRPSTGEAAL